MTPAEIFTHPGLYRLEIGQLQETLRVMAAHADQPSAHRSAAGAGARRGTLGGIRPAAGED